MRAAARMEGLDEAQALTLRVDEQGRLLELNGAGQAALGARAGVGTSWFDLVPRHLAPQARTALAPWLSGTAGSVAVFQCPLNWPDGTPRGMAWTLLAATSGGATLSGEPLPDEAQSSEWLAPMPLHAALAERSARRSTEERLRRVSDDLARANKDLEQFVWSSSHELQEPLRAVRSFAGMLARQYKGKLDREADEFLGHLVEGANRMQGLINGLLSWSRVDAQGNTFTATDCNALLKPVLADLQRVIQETQATITVDPLPRLRGDGMQLAQVFSHLINNAVKFRGEAPPEVRVSVTEDGPRWLFSVRDNGIGIPPDAADGLFRPFHRLHPTSEYPGNGLGLALCKRVIERHGGRIWVEPVPSGGSDFRFYLPRI
jgi:signal transduction histidine kinase